VVTWVLVRCERHNLAAGPEGRCILCIREDAPVSVRVPPSSFPASTRPTGSRTGWLAVALFVVCGTAGYVWMRSRSVQIASASASPIRPGELSTGEIKRAVESTPITIYMTHTCPVCEKARGFMADNRIPYREKDVDDNDGLRQQLIAINPRHTVPTFDIDGSVLVGFAPQDVVDAISASVERRYGYKLKTGVRTK
jgi:glutaredoxin 3